MQAQNARSLKRRLGVAEETVRIKKEQFEQAEKCFEEEHSSFTSFSKRLEEKWEQRFDSLAVLAAGAGVRAEDIAAIRTQPWQAGTMQPENAEPETTVAEQATADTTNMEEAAALAAAHNLHGDETLMRVSFEDTDGDENEYVVNADGGIDCFLNGTLWSTNLTELLVIKGTNRIHDRGHDAAEPECWRYGTSIPIDLGMTDRLLRLCHGRVRRTGRVTQRKRRRI